MFTKINDIKDYIRSWVTNVLIVYLLTEKQDTNFSSYTFSSYKEIIPIFIKDGFFDERACS